MLDGLILFRIGDFCTKSVQNNEIYTLHVVEAWMLFMGSAWEGGVACPSKFLYFNKSSSLDNLNMCFVTKLHTIQLFKEKNVIVTVLLEWLTALLEYLNLALQLIQALNELLGHLI